MAGVRKEAKSKGGTTMSIDKSIDENIPAHTDDYYEALASQEQECLDEGVEKLREREILVSAGTTDGNNNAQTAESRDEQVNAAEELIVGDPDDLPLSDEEVVVMLRKDFA
jgi:hypothetical protein